MPGGLAYALHALYDGRPQGVNTASTNATQRGANCAALRLITGVGNAACPAPPYVPSVQWCAAHRQGLSSSSIPAHISPSRHCKSRRRVCPRFPVGILAGRGGPPEPAAQRTAPGHSLLSLAARSASVHPRRALPVSWEPNCCPLPPHIPQAV